VLESNLLAHIAANSAGLTKAFPWVKIGPGDDCAVIDIGPGLLLLKVDQVVEGRHFRTGTPSTLIARKALGRALSDIAAMGGEPIVALAACVLPASTSQPDATTLFDAVADWGRHWQCPVVGGDISTHINPHAPLTLSITIIGRPNASRGPILRSGAQDGDLLYTTGHLGGSFDEATGMGRHLEVSPRLHEGHWLAHTLKDSLHAMIDISDGLGIDSARIARASGLRIEIDGAALPLHPGVSIINALRDGEDYELLFTLAPDAARSLPPSCPHTNVPFTRIGRITLPDARGPGAWLIDARGEHDVSALGWEHT
jgi:thiamine-monophosphate kinase